MKVEVSTTGGQLSVFIEHRGHNLTLSEAEFAVLWDAVRQPWIDLCNKRREAQEIAFKKAAAEAELRASTAELIEDVPCRILFGFDQMDAARPETWLPDLNRIRRILVGTNDMDEARATAVVERMGFGGSSCPRPYGFKVPRPSASQIDPGRIYYYDNPARYVTARAAASGAIRWLKKKQEAAA